MNIKTNSRITNVELQSEVKNLKAKVKALEYELNHDYLTKIVNRRGLAEAYAKDLEAIEKRKSMYAYIAFDLDKFKSINDTYGHESGDLVLKAVASRIKASVRKTDTAARIGGDEFIAIVKVDSEADAVKIGERLKALSDEKVEITEGRKIEVYMSMGITLFNTRKTQKQLAAEADQALYNVKGSGRNNYSIFKQKVKPA